MKNLDETMEKKIEGLAFPKPDNEEYHPQDGLTKREYFAGLAMQGLLTRSPNRTNEDAVLGILESKRIAEESVIMSDELLKQLAQL